MWLVVVGMILLVLKMAGLGPAGLWSWWLVLAPFAGALVWWQVADQMGWTQRAAQRRDNERQQRRREARMEALGMRPTRSGSLDSRMGPGSRSGAGSRNGPSSRLGPDSGNRSAGHDGKRR